MSTEAPSHYCIDGSQLTRVTDALKAVGMLPAPSNAITESDVLVVVFPTTDTQALLIDVAVEMAKRVLVISAQDVYAGTEHFPSVTEFERAMLAEAAKAVAA